MSSETARARRWGRLMGVVSVLGTIIAMAAWVVRGATAGATVYAGVFLVLAGLLILRAGAQALAPGMHTRGALPKAIPGRKRLP